MNKILIYSGQIKSGKTTTLHEWAKEQNNIDGILAPVINNKRHLLRIMTNEKKLLEQNDFTDKIINIGKYYFSQSVFEWGQNQLLDSFNCKNEYIIIDEIGPLELRGEGLEPAVSKIISDKLNSKKIILVVREKLVDEVIKHYKLDKTGLFVPSGGFPSL